MAPGFDGLSFDLHRLVDSVLVDSFEDFEWIFFPGELLG